MPCARRFALAGPGADGRRLTVPSNAGPITNSDNIEHPPPDDVQLGECAGSEFGGFDGAVSDPGIVAEAWDTWRAEVAFAEQYVAQSPDLDIVGKEGDVLREVLVHMIEEYARHNGHADLLRERIDGRVGQ